MKKKNLSLGIVLTFLFDAFGIIYTSLAGFLFFLILGTIIYILLNKFLNPAELMVLKPNATTISSSGGMRGKVASSPQWEFSTKHLLVYIVTGIISKTVLLYWTYNVIKEKNRRIDLNLPKMTGWEEIDFGFKNLFYVFLTFLVLWLFTCGLFALATVVPNFTKTTDSFQMIFFFSVFGIILVLWIVYWFRNRKII